MAQASPPRSFDEYIAGFPPATRQTLEELRSLLHAVVPEATETISYAMLTFDLNGKHLVHFAAWAQHIGLYPAPVGVAAFAGELKAYKTTKSALQLPLDRPLPADLIRRIVEYRIAKLFGTIPR